MYTIQITAVAEMTVSEAWITVDVFRKNMTQMRFR